jgi:hypothetical protein
MIAVDYLGIYNNLMRQDLLIYCIKHEHDFFMRSALILAAFDKMLFREDAVINEILTILKRGYSTNYILNILSLIDISVWRSVKLKSLIEILNTYVVDSFNKNRLLMSSNPLLSIALTCELLTKIANARKKYESECFQIS